MDGSTGRFWGRSQRLLGLALACLLLEVGVAAAAPDARHGTLACGECHLAGGGATATNAILLVARQDKLCVDCHQRAVEASHPVGFTPARPLPAEFPLDWQGQMTCTTCHKPHGETSSGVLGAAPDQSLCLACHDDGFFRQMADRGESVRGRAHLAARDRPATSVDLYSLQCMNCHDDKVAVSAGGMNNLLRSASFGGGANHPIGMAYEGGAGQRGFRDAAMLPRGVLLPDGKVSCLSCHEGYGREHGKLVSSEGELCLGCHDK
jgi:predicted CXXCH cytochrome family protein